MLNISGAVVAARLTASAAPSREAWWFWSDQYDVKYQMAGLVPALTGRLYRLPPAQAGAKTACLSGLMTGLNLCLLKQMTRKPI